MTGKTGHRIAHYFATCFVIATIFFAAGCTKHLSESTAKLDNKSRKGQSHSTADSLIGVWKLDRIESPDAPVQSATYGSQGNSDAISKKLAGYQNALQGLTVTFNKDSTYQSVYSGQSDLGTWTVNTKWEIKVISKLTGNTLIYQITGLSGTSIQTKVNFGDIAILMTFIKK